MLSLKEIEKFYPDNLQPFKKFILREYLQYKILEIIFESEYHDKLCFLGGTCLRIVHGNNRFSEDLDFDNFSLTPNDFENISVEIQNQLTKQGYEVEIKNVFAGAYHCYIKFPGLLFNEKLSEHIEQKILIQLVTEPQNFNFEVEQHFLNKFDVFTMINTTPKDILLSQKFYALLNRPRKKGRDFYDIVFLLKTTRPNYDYLNVKVGIRNPKELLNEVVEVCNKLNFKEIANDVKPFLINNSDIKTVNYFPKYMIDVLN